MNKFLIVAFAIVGACTSPSADIRIEEYENRTRIYLDTSNPGYKAAQYLNFEERTHRTELQELTGVDPVRTEWCAAFVNAVLEESDIESNSNHPYPLTARAFLDWGVNVDSEDIRPGDIVVFPRGSQGWQGHVGFYIRTIRLNGIDYYWILGGNQSNKVSIVRYRASRALGIRRQGSNA